MTCPGKLLLLTHTWEGKGAPMAVNYPNGVWWWPGVGTAIFNGTSFVQVTGATP